MIIQDFFIDSRTGTRFQKISVMNVIKVTRTPALRQQSWYLHDLILSMQKLTFTDEITRENTPMIMRLTIKILAVTAACLVGAAQAAELTSNEVEPNHPIGSAQTLSVSGTTAVPAALGNGGTNDLDYFRFYANAGDVLTIDIDNGIGGSQNVDTIIALFSGGPDCEILRQNDDAPDLDDGSAYQQDSRIDNFVAPTTGYYFVGVSNFPRGFDEAGDCGAVVNSDYSEAGDYTLRISGATEQESTEEEVAEVQYIAIRIKPGNNNVAPMNPKSRGRIPVAILGGPDFNPLNIDRQSLTFGSSGDENSLAKCNWKGADLNNDGRVDLICHFNNHMAGFKPTDLEATLRGRINGGMEFEGTGYLKIVPMAKGRK